MAYVKIIRCNRCGQPCRNDSTEENQKWVCNNSQKPCVKYRPPKTEPLSIKEGEGLLATDK